jgi:hypothetical protein
MYVKSVYTVSHSRSGDTTMPTLHIPYTLTLVSNLGRDAALGTIKRGFVAEIDATLDVDYADARDWEITSITFEQTKWTDEFSVDEASDPDLWKLIERSFEYDWKDLGDKVREFIVEDHAEYGDDRGDYLRDRQMGR